MSKKCEQDEGFTLCHICDRPLGIGGSLEDALAHTPYCGHCVDSIANKQRTQAFQEVLDMIEAEKLLGCTSLVRRIKEKMVKE